MPKGCRPLTKATKAAKKDLCDISTGSSETFSAIKSSKSDRLCKKIHLKRELYCQQNNRIRSINPPPEPNPFLIEGNKSYHSVPSFHYSETKLLVGLSRIVFLAMLLLCCLPPILVESTKDAARLFDDLLADYNKLVRPVDDNNATLIVKFKLKLSQLLDVHEKNQIMTTNVWLQHSWLDQKLKWHPEDYGGVEVLYVPSEMIWLPDIVLYNNADGNYKVSIMTKAKLSYNGTVEWTPPAIYKSMCQIDVEWFPMDVQTCEMRFGSWTYIGLEVDLKHRDEHLQREETEWVQGPEGVDKKEIVWVVDEGIDLSDYYPSVEWDILRVPGKRHEKRYPCCVSPFIDITYEIYLRRRTLFYTVNLMIPCVGISFLTALVFYLPSDGGEKISLCISILISLTVFFLLLVEMIPSTSLVIPLIGKYLLFTMVLVTLSVIVTVITLNVHYRRPSTHNMSPWVRKLFIEILPPYLLMRRPPQQERPRVNSFIASAPQDSYSSILAMPPGRRASRKRSSTRKKSSIIDRSGSNASFKFRRDTTLSSTFVEQRASFLPRDGRESAAFSQQDTNFTAFHEKTPLRSAVESVSFIAEHFRREKEDQEVIEDWKYVSVVIDRIFLILFTMVCLIGCVHIIFRAPVIYDTTPALA